MKAEIWLGCNLAIQGPLVGELKNSTKISGGEGRECVSEIPDHLNLGS